MPCPLNRPFACRTGTGHWRYASAILKGEAGQPWLTIVVFLSAIRSHRGNKNYPILSPLSKMRVKKKKWKVKIRCDKGNCLLQLSTLGCVLFILRPMITEHYLVGLKFSRMMLCPQYSTGKHQSISTCQRQVHVEWGR